MGIVLATLPIGIVGLALSRILNECATPIRGLKVIGVASLLMGLLLALAKILCRHTRKVEDMSLCYALSVLPRLERWYPNKEFTTNKSAQPLMSACESLDEISVGLRSRLLST